MSESTTPPPSPDSPPAGEAEKPKKKKWVQTRPQKIGFKQKMALLEVIERKKYNDRPDYKAISARTGLSVGYLKQLYCRWTKGLIDLGEPETPEEAEIDAKMQHEKTLKLLKRYHGLLLSDFEATLIAAEDSKTRGKKLAWRDAGANIVARELAIVMRMREFAERGYNAALEEFSARNAPKNVTPQQPSIETKVVSISDEARALEAFHSHDHAASETLPQSPPGGVPQQNGSGN